MMVKTKTLELNKEKSIITKLGNSAGMMRMFVSVWNVFLSRNALYSENPFKCHSRITTMGTGRRLESIIKNVFVLFTVNNNNTP